MAKWHSYELFPELPESAMIWVEGGRYMRGSNEEEHEQPIHEVELSSFYLGQYPVSQALWEQVMGQNPARFKDGGALPVESVSWEDCQVFLKELNKQLGLDGEDVYRLPTEAEWEYAARGVNMRVIQNMQALGS